jgi:Asp-tRNA(Asn)/Glu-tRNA(Gln) amidotransferase A subunit family amidase
MEGLTALPATELVRLMRERAVSPVEVAKSYLTRVESLNPSLNAIVCLAPDVLERARRAEDALMKGRSLGALHGLPVTIKDTFDVTGLRSTSGSRLRAGRVPERDAAAVERLRAAGAVILGKTNVPEMALTYDADNPVYGRTGNPHDLGRVPGGSSGGEAASIAACLSAAGLGSDLVGSLRVPAHFCGIFGLKPTAGAVSGRGHCPDMRGRLKEAAAFGPMARTAADLSLMFGVLSGAEPSASELKDSERKRLRVAYYTSDGRVPVTADVRLAVEGAARALSRAGFEVVETLPPGIERGAALWRERFWPDVIESVRTVYRSEEDEEMAGRAVRALLQRAAHAPLKGERELLKVDEECRRLRQSLIEWMDAYPLVLAPVGASAAFEHGARRLKIEDEEVSVFNAFGYAQSFNTFNLPVACVPAGRTPTGLPVGVQLAGRPFQEETVLWAARVLEEALGGWQPPPLALPTGGHN